MCVCVFVCVFAFVCLTFGIYLFMFVFCVCFRANVAFHFLLSFQNVHFIRIDYFIIFFFVLFDLYESVRVRSFVCVGM